MLRTKKLAQLQQKAAALTADAVKISGQINEKISETDALTVQQASNEEHAVMQAPSE